MAQRCGVHAATGADLRRVLEMENTRKVVIFPVDQFYAIVGNITMSGDPYRMRLTDICNDMAGATHNDHDHRHSGTIYLSSAEFYSMENNQQKVCCTLTVGHLAVKNIQGVIDFYPDRFKGNPHKRYEHHERHLKEGKVKFRLNDHVLNGVADEFDISRYSDVYRFADKFIGLHKLHVVETPATEVLSLSGFMENIGCRFPDYMAVNLSNAFYA